MPAETVDGIRVEAKIVAGSFSCFGHDARVAQYLEVLRDRGTRFRKRVGKLANGTGALAQPLDDVAPGSIAQRRQQCGDAAVGGRRETRERWCDG